MPEKCRNNINNNSSDNPLTSLRTDGGDNLAGTISNRNFFLYVALLVRGTFITIDCLIQIRRFSCKKGSKNNKNPYARINNPNYFILFPLSGRKL